MKKILILLVIVFAYSYANAQLAAKRGISTGDTIVSVQEINYLKGLKAKVALKINIADGEQATNNFYLKTEVDNLLSSKSSLTGAETLTNKRWVARVGNTTSSATPTINTDSYDIYKITAQTVAITSMSTNLSGTPTDGQILEIQITGTAAIAIAWGTLFVASTVTLPTTTVTTTTLTGVFQWFSTSSYGNNKWVCVNVF